MFWGFVALAALLLCSPLVRNVSNSIRAQLSSLLRPFLVGLAMLVIAYALAITPPHYPPEATYGRMTSVHLAATVGGAIVFACFLKLLLTLFGIIHLRAVFALILAAYLALLVGFAFIVQKSFIIALQDQRKEWTSVVELCPDIADGTMVLLEGPYPTGNWFALNSSWSDPLVLPQLFRYPSTIKTPPMLGLVPSDHSWTAKLKPQDGRLVWAEAFPPFTGRPAGLPLPENNTILLRMVDDGSRMIRIDGDLSIQGRSFQLKSPPRQPLPLPFEPGTLYPLLINESRLPAQMRHGSVSGPIRKD